LGVVFIRLKRQYQLYTALRVGVFLPLQPDRRIQWRIAAPSIHSNLHFSDTNQYLSLSLSGLGAANHSAGVE
jgi:hypothetical protein